MRPLPCFRPRTFHSRAAYRALVAAVAAVSAPLAAAPLAAQDSWDPFSQLDTSRQERRSKKSAKPVTPPTEPAPGRAGYDEPGAQGAYLAPVEREPGNASQPGTYYPPRSDDARPLDQSAEPSQRGSGQLEPHDPRRGGQARERGHGGEPAPRFAPVPAVDGLPASSGARAVERGELTPVMATDGSALPYELWRGLDISQIEQLIATLKIPPRSPALADLWRRLIIADVAAPAGGESHAHFEALRLEALYRSGMLAEIREALAQRKGQETSPLVAMLRARSEIGLGRREAGCDIAKGLGNIRGEIPKSLRGEAIMVSGYCAAASGNAPAAGLLAGLAREEGLPPSPGLAALDAVALGAKTDVSVPKGGHLSLIDYRILDLAGATPPAQDIAGVATPALLSAIVIDATAAPDVKLVAAEAAARINAVQPDALADVYRSASGKMAAPDTPIDAAPGGRETPQRRAVLFASAEAERTPFKKVRLIRSFLDSARRDGLYAQALVMAAKLTAELGLVPEIGWFAETAIEANLAAGDFQRARMWAKFAKSLDSGRGGANLDHWQALIDIADADFPDGRGKNLASVERMALSGRFSSELLHRLATVLDALEYNVPIPLWEAASRTPQPTAGHLPATGILTQLQDAAKKREFARTVLLTMQTLGTEGADRAHMIALGDAIRALKRAGLEKDARRLGYEALIAGWPHATSN